MLVLVGGMEAILQDVLLLVRQNYANEEMAWRFGLLQSVKVKSLRAVSLRKTADKVAGFSSSQAVPDNFPAPFSLNSRFTFLRIHTWPSIRLSLRVAMSHIRLSGNEKNWATPMLPDGN